MNNDNNFLKSNNNSPVRHRKILIATSLILVLILLVITIGYYSNQKNIDIAIEKMSNLFVDTNELNVLEGVPGILKDLPDHKGIYEARDAINKIKVFGGEKSESYAIVSGLQSSLLVAYDQLIQRNIAETNYILNSKEDEHEEQEVQLEQLEQYQPGEDDVIWIDNELKNKGLMEEFMKNSGGNGKSNDLEIRTVRDFGKNGVIIFDIKSVYADYADQGWVEVKVDYSHYTPTEESNYIDTFVKRPQQCSHISKNFESGYYVFNECYTDLEYPFLPFRSEEQD